MKYLKLFENINNININIIKQYNNFLDSIKPNVIFFYKYKYDNEKDEEESEYYDLDSYNDVKINDVVTYNNDNLRFSLLVYEYYYSAPEIIYFFVNIIEFEQYILSKKVEKYNL